MYRIGIRASDETQRRDMMRGNHARIARVELVSPSTAPQLRGDLVDALGDDQNWSIGGLRQKVSHRTVETSRQHDAFPLLCYEGKGAVDAEHCPDVTSEQPAPCFRFINRPESLRVF